MPQGADRKRRRLTELGSQAREEVSHHAGSVREGALRPASEEVRRAMRPTASTPPGLVDRLYRLLLPILV